MLRQLTARRPHRAVAGSVVGTLTQMRMYNPWVPSISPSTMTNAEDAGMVELARRDEDDFTYTGKEEVSGAHPLPLHNEQTASHRWPLVSPFMPAPQRVHPYWTKAPEEFPHFGPSVPVVYTHRCMKHKIIVPVFNLEGEITHTRELDPFVFGRWPDNEAISQNVSYWILRCQNFKDRWDFADVEIFRPAKKAYPNHGTGMVRASDKKNARYSWGGRTQPNKPWNLMMPTAQPPIWQMSNRMMLTLKMLQGKLQIVDELKLPEPSVAAFDDLCQTMRWDARHDGAGVMFMDGGSRLTPSQEFNSSFLYGSFKNGRVKVVRPTVIAPEPYDYNQIVDNQNFKGPKGQKNPIPFNRFNCFDAFEHHLLVITEGALLQLEHELEPIKIESLPPHIRQQMPDRQMLGSEFLGDVNSNRLTTIEEEAAARMEESEMGMYKGYYDNPYKPWQDEDKASYQVDAVDGVVRREVDGRSGSWKRLE